MKKEAGADGFSKKYWDENYSSPREMDGIGNAKDHARYIKLVFKMEMVDISSVVDFGYGTGHLFKEVMKTFIPYKALGIEPSKYIFEKTSAARLRPVESTNLKIQNIDLKTWADKNKLTPKRYDLGICTSVFQYLSGDDIDFCLEEMSKSCKYLYFTVPTDMELDRQIEDLEFKDVYAKRRSRTWYQKKLKKHFTFISSRLLESKVYFDEESTSFTDLLYRF